MTSAARLPPNCQPNSSGEPIRSATKSALAANAQPPGIDAQRMRRRTRHAVERLGGRQPEKLAAEVGDGLQVKTRRRAGVVIACERDRARRLRAGREPAHAAQARDTTIGRRAGDRNDAALGDRSHVLGRMQLQWSTASTSSGCRHRRRPAVGHLVAMHAQPHAVQARSLEIAPRLLRRKESRLTESIGVDRTVRGRRRNHLVDQVIDEGLLARELRRQRVRAKKGCDQVRNVGIVAMLRDQIEQRRLARLVQRIPRLRLERRRSVSEHRAKSRANRAFRRIAAGSSSASRVRSTV